MAKSVDGSRFDVELHLSGATSDGGAQLRTDNPGFLAKASAACSRVLLGISSRSAAAASAAAAGLIVAHSLAIGPLPAPLYVLPALFAGWGRCGAPIAAVSLSVTALAAAAGGNAAWPATAAFVVSVTVLAAIWWGALTVRGAYEEEQSSARCDGLTGCLTLRAFHEALGSKLDVAREQGRPVALAYLDLDHFKDVNDRYGHAVGDRLLREFATELRDRLLPQDVVGRLGGDEFAVLLAEVYGPCAVQRFEQLVHEILGAQEFPVTASIGALVIDPGATVSQSELIVMTDHLMYEAKRSGKATVRTNIVEPEGPRQADLAA